MKKFFIFLTVLVTVIGMHSCGNADEPMKEVTSQEADYEVVVIDMSNHTTRATIGTSPVVDTILKFKDREAYERTLDSVKQLDEASKKRFFKKLGFNGAYSLLSKANDDFDEAFDLAETLDSISGVKVIMDCVAKYDGVLVFNDSDSVYTDVTPSLPFTDENAKLLGNKDGYVMIGNELVAPKAGPTPVYNGYFIKYNAEVKVKNGKYTSYFRLGRIGVNLAFQLETYRKVFFFKISDKNCKYNGELLIRSDNGKLAMIPMEDATCGNWKIRYLAKDFSPIIHMTMTNFSSTRNPKNKVSKTINKILVK